MADDDAVFVEKARRVRICHSKTEGKVGIL